MKNNLYQIKNGAVTLYVRAEREAHFSFSGLVVEDDENVYTPNDFCSCAAGRPHVGLREHLFAVYEAKANEQLADYLEQHINDPLLTMGFTDFWSKAGIKPEFSYRKSICLDQVADGIVGIVINGCTCSYSVVAKEPAGYTRCFGRTQLPVTPMSVFYGDEVNQLLALEQYRRGMAPPAYTELARLNAFLEGKKSIKLVMKNGVVHEFKPNYGVYLHELLNYTPQSATPFSFNNSYYSKPRLQRGHPLSDLAYLQYGKQQFVIDVDALSKFEREEVESNE